MWRLRRVLTLAAVAFVGLFALVLPALAAEAALTIRGRLVSFDGSPVGNYPVCLTPLQPGAKGMDIGGKVWRIPNYDDHATVTDENGGFVMTGVIDYPQVDHHQYRIWGGNDGQTADEPRLRYPFLRFAYMVDLSKVAANPLYVVVRGEPAAAFRMTVKDRDGRPYNGTLALGLVSGGHSYNFTANVKDGLYVRTSVPTGNQREMGRLVILSEKTAEEAKEKAVARGEKVGGMQLITAGAVVDRQVPFLPFQWSTIEVTLPFTSD